MSCVLTVPQAALNDLQHMNEDYLVRADCRRLTEPSYSCMPRDSKIFPISAVLQSSGIEHALRPKVALVIVSNPYESSSRP